MKLVFMNQDMNYEDNLNNQTKKVTRHLTGIPFFTGCHLGATINKKIEMLFLTLYYFTKTKKQRIIRKLKDGTTKKIL